MLKLNFLLVLRRIRKDKKSFLINLIGSSIGLTAIILMSLYINYEDNYDTFNENTARLFRIERTVSDNVQNQTFDSTPYELPEELTSSFPEIINASSVRTTINFLSIGEKSYPKERGVIADNNFLEMFSFEFIDGNQDNALTRPMSIVLSESLANKLFSEGEAIGKTVRTNKKHELTVSGVFKDYPKDSHISMDYIISFNSYEGLYGEKKEKGWDQSYSSTYVLLGNSVKENELSGKIRNFLSTHVDYLEGNDHTLSLRPITDVYIKTADVRNDAMGGLRNNIVVIYLFFLVAFFTAFVTIVNYVNLTTAQLTNRELEIGIKKVLGISKTQLRYQFVIESLLMVIGALLLSALLVVLILPVFSSIVDRELPLAFQGSLFFFSKVFLISIFFGILGGLYPVFYLSSLKISSFLQGTTSIKRRKYLRKGLVLFQLFITIPLIFLSFRTISQINYLNDKDLGFNKENVLMTWVYTSEKQDLEKLKVIKNTLLQNPNIENYSLAECAPFFGFGEEKEVNWGDNSTQQKVKLSTYGVDQEFINVFKIHLLKGRWFSKEYLTDKESSCVINETTASLLGWEDPIGKTLENLKVIGVVKDFDQVSLLMKIPPMMLTMNSESRASTVVSIKISDTNRQETKREVNEIFNAHFREIPIEFGFLEDGFDKGYMSVLENVMKIFILFSIISIILVIIGLYSLISFSLKMQKKTIAIRKVLGSSTKELFRLILKEYIVLYIIAASTSLVLTYFLIQEISKISANSVEVGILDFMTVIGITLFIVMATISGKIWSASKENPLDAITIE
ncbi:ABC transporter permease [Aquimarina addita]|uniref:ABC transporter permease n=1 Tax=Aquimarina addita TaxID=870485 RepID=A0ABP7XGC1_9FLAO